MVPYQLNSSQSVAHVEVVLLRSRTLKSISTGLL
jgi:hypothetical protein